MAIEKSTSPTEFLDFERAGWGANIAGYDDAFGPVSRQTVCPMLDAANVAAGMRLLDVCCGPGMLAEGALARGASAVGVDFPDVVKLAKKLVPVGDFQPGDAQALAFPDNSFDAVVCGYGIIHLPEPEKALREMFRVLRPGGRAAVSVWDSNTPNNGFSLVYAAVRAHGRMDVGLPHGPDYFQFSTHEKMRASLSEVGFKNVESIFFDQRWHVKTVTQVLDAILKGTVRARAVMAAQSEESMAKIRQFYEQTLNGMKNPAGGFDVPLPALIGSGAKP
jgi:ubiquinone/menaquinone biosynthesis C-methylase UbiE